MVINPSEIAPSQDFLKPGTVGFIFECISTKKYGELPPTPIIRQDLNGNYVAIDGHNLIAVRSFLNQEVEVHLAANSKDGLAPTSEENANRNKDLFEKFESSLIERDRVASLGVRTFHDLVRRNMELFENAV